MRIYFPIIVIILSIMSCNTYEKVLKSDDVNYKLTKANEYYDKGKWFDANMVYESLLPVFKGNKNYEELYYRYAYTFYNQGDYLNAAYQFKNFTEYFSKSPRAQEMEYMYAVSLFKDSKKSSLDQTTTERSIAAFQNFINMNPESSFRLQALNYMDSALSKLETKDADAALQYYNMDQYKSSIIAYQTLIYDYPDSKKLDYYHYMVVKSMYDYAINSRTTVQEERYLNTINFYENLKTYFPDSKYTKQAGDIVSIAQTKLNKLKLNDQQQQ